jgi:hypothetical protein
VFLGKDEVIGKRVKVGEIGSVSVSSKAVLNEMKGTA